MNILSSTVGIESFTAGIEFHKSVEIFILQQSLYSFSKIYIHKVFIDFYATKEIVTEHFVKWFARLPLWLLLEYW